MKVRENLPAAVTQRYPVSASPVVGHTGRSLRSQEMKTLRESGVWSVFNPSVAMVQTSWGSVDWVYLLLLTPEFGLVNGFSWTRSNCVCHPSEMRLDSRALCRLGSRGPDGCLLLVFLIVLYGCAWRAHERDQLFSLGYCLLPNSRSVLRMGLFSSSRHERLTCCDIASQCVATSLVEATVWPSGSYGCVELRPKDALTGPQSRPLRLTCEQKRVE